MFKLISNRAIKVKKCSFFNLVSLTLIVFCSVKLNGALAQPTYRDLTVKTEKLESGLDATVVSDMYGSWYDRVSIALSDDGKPFIAYKNPNYRIELAFMDDSRNWKAMTLCQIWTSVSLPQKVTSCSASP